MTGQTLLAFDWKPDLSGPDLSLTRDILDLVEPQLTSGGDHLALVDGRASLSYAELDLLSAAAARALTARGIGPGDVVAVRTRLSRWAIIGMLGVLRSGARYAAIDAAFPAERQSLYHRASGAELEIAEPGLPLDHDGASVDLATLITAGLNLDHLPLAPHNPQDGAYTQFTSGSTGVPKAVTVTRRALAFSTAARLEYYRDPLKVFLLCSSISFDSSVAGIYWTLSVGGTLVIPADKPSNIVAIAKAARAHQATHLLLLPSLYELLLAANLRDQLTSLKTVVVAGEVCPTILVRKHFAALSGSQLYNEYGPTECTVWSTVHDCRPEDADRSAVPIGKAIPGALLYLRDPKLPERPAARGELWIGGPGVVETLAGQPERISQLATVAGGLVYRTGDLVSVAPDGVLDFHGRTDSQLKLGGLRIELGEVEQVILSHPTVRAVAVGVADRNSQTPFLNAYFTADAPVTAAMLRGHLMERLPAVAIPAAFTAVETLPSHPNGKLDRATLNEWAAMSRGQRAASTAAL